MIIVPTRAGDPETGHVKIDRRVWRNSTGATNFYKPETERVEKKNNIYSIISMKKQHDYFNFQPELTLKDDLRNLELGYHQPVTLSFNRQLHTGIKAIVSHVCIWFECADLADLLL